MTFARIASAVLLVGVLSYAGYVGAMDLAAIWRGQR